MAKKPQFLITAGASIVVIRDGKRKVVPAGGGEHFTDEEITTVKRIVPGALRTPVNEGTGNVDATADAADADVDADDDTKVPAKTEKPAKVAKAPSKPAKPAKTDADDTDDEDI